MPQKEQKEDEDIFDMKLGATGKFPGGKKSENDLGQLLMEVNNANGLVYLTFGTPVSQIGFQPLQAEELASLLLLFARKVQIETLLQESKTSEREEERP